MARLGRAIPFSPVLPGIQRFATLAPSFYEMFVACGVVGDATCAPIVADMVHTAALESIGDATAGDAHDAVLNSALIQAAAVVLTDPITVESLLALGVNAGLDAQMTGALAHAVALACSSMVTTSTLFSPILNAALSGQASFTYTGAGTLRLSSILSTQAALAQTSTLTAQLVSILAGGASALTVATLNMSLVGMLAASADVLARAGVTTAMVAPIVAQASLTAGILRNSALTTSVSAVAAVTSTQQAMLSLYTLLSGQAATTPTNILLAQLATAIFTQAAMSPANVTSRTMALSMLAELDMPLSDSFIRTISVSLAVQSGLALVTRADLAHAVALAQASILSETTGQSIAILSSFTSSTSIVALADIFKSMQVSVMGAATLSTVQQFTTIGQMALAVQTMLTHASVGIFGVAVALASESRDTAKIDAIHHAAVALSSDAAVAVLTNIFHAYLLSVGLGTVAALSAAEQQALVSRIVEDVTAALQTQQIAQFTALTQLGVHPLQAVAATSTMQMLTAMGTQTLLTTAAEHIALVAPDVIRLVNERLLQAMGIRGTLKK